jgi:hypothetical protein
MTSDSGLTTVTNHGRAQSFPFKQKPGAGDETRTEFPQPNL